MLTHCAHRDFVHITSHSFSLRSHFLALECQLIVTITSYVLWFQLVVCYLDILLIVVTLLNTLKCVVLSIIMFVFYVHRVIVAAQNRCINPCYYTKKLPTT